MRQLRNTRHLNQDLRRPGRQPFAPPAKIITAEQDQEIRVLRPRNTHKSKGWLRAHQFG